MLASLRYQCSAPSRWFDKTPSVGLGTFSAVYYVAESVLES
jgi:hypothetical protein